MAGEEAATRRKIKLHKLPVMKSPGLAILCCFFLSCSSQKKAADQTLPELNILSRSAWNALEPKPYKQHVPVRITIHHEGTRLEVSDDAARKIRNIQVWGMGPDRNWKDIPYHFLIAPDGKIFEGRNVFTVGETATEYDPTGHLLVTCLGNLEQQEVREEQLESLVRTIAYACRKYNIPPDSIASHRDYSSQTTCPGKNLYRYLEDGSIKKRVGALLKKA